MKTCRTFVLLAMVCLLIVSIAGCGKSSAGQTSGNTQTGQTENQGTVSGRHEPLTFDSQEDLIFRLYLGKWAKGSVIQYLFEEDGTGTFYEKGMNGPETNFTYEIDGDMLLITCDGKPEQQRYPFELWTDGENDYLTIEYGTDNTVDYVDL